MEAVKVIEKNSRTPETTRAPALTNRRGLRSVAGGLLHLCLEDANGIRSSYPLERIPVPAALDHGPHAVRDFGMNRSRRSVVVEYGEDYCRLNSSCKRGLSGEDLEPMNTSGLGDTRKIGLPPRRACRTQTCQSPWWCGRGRVQTLEG